MSTEKDTCQKSGTSAIFPKKKLRSVGNVLIVESLQTLMTGSMTMMKKSAFVKKQGIN